MRRICSLLQTVCFGKKSPDPWILKFWLLLLSLSTVSTRFLKDGLNTVELLRQFSSVLHTSFLGCFWVLARILSEAFWTPFQPSAHGSEKIQHNWMTPKYALPQERLSQQCEVISSHQQHLRQKQMMHVNPSYYKICQSLTRVIVEDAPLNLHFLFSPWQLNDQDEIGDCQINTIWDKN